MKPDPKSAGEGRALKTFAVRIWDLGEVQNIGVPAHQVARSGGNREIDIWLVFGVTLLEEHPRHFRNENRSLLNCRKKPVDKLVPHRGELLP